MGEGRGDGCERESVGNGECCGNEDGTVSLVSLDVECGVIVDDSGDVVLFSRIIKGVRGDYGKVSAVPNVGVLQNPILRLTRNVNGGEGLVSHREWERGTSRKM